MPSARFMPEGSLAFSWNKNEPYLRGSIVAYPFSWMEASYQYTDINNALYSDVPEFSGSQSYKDKSFDFKFRLLKETDLLPEVAIGARDVAGTGVFSSEYLVFNKRFNNLDLTLGIGWGTLSENNIKNPLSSISDEFSDRENLDETLGGEFNTGYFFSGQAGLFGGMEYILPRFKGLRLKVEYDGTDYTKEGFPYGADSFQFGIEPIKQPTSQFNFGVVYPLSNSFHLKLGYIKGNTINIGFSIQNNLGRKNPILVKNSPRRIIPEPTKEALKIVNNRSNINLYRNSLKYLKEEGFFLQNANYLEKDNTLEIVYSESTNMSMMRSAGRVASILDDISPEKVKNFRINYLNGGLGLFSLKINRDSFTRYKDTKSYELALLDSEVISYEHSSDNYEYQPVTKYPVHYLKFSPSIRSQIGGPDGFYFGDIRIAAHSELIFQRGLVASTNISYGLGDNFDELKLASDSVLPHVRTDIVKYLKETDGIALNQMTINWFNQFNDEIYYKLSGGVLEAMFAGIGGEILYRPFKGSLAIGAELWRVKQRDYDMTFDFLDYQTTTGHINIFYTEPRSQVTLAMKGGRFLAEDSGINFDFSRRFKSGLVIGAFFSLTDISKAEFGEGSFDKGFYFQLPIELFLSGYSKGRAGFGLRPLTRDGAAYLVHSHPLYGVTENGHYRSLWRDRDDIYD